jgi:hypothetical protein
MNLRASLFAPRFPQASAASGEEATPLLNPRGARVILGMPNNNIALATPIAPAADTLFGPRGVTLAGREGPLIVCDTGHHRVLIWRTVPVFDNVPADLLIGQPHFHSEGRNARGEAGASTLNVPTGVATEDGVLAVADAWNHRVLIWHHIPERLNQPADVVIGQADFISTGANRRADRPGADTLNWCYGVALHAGRLYVADTGNRRVLVWNRIPECNGMPADLVLGQRDFATRDEGGGHAPAAGMRWPHAITVMNDHLFVADAGSSRIMAWNGLPTENGQRCHYVLGQRDFRGGDHNAGENHPSAASLNMPYGLYSAAGQLIVADTANSRLLGFELGTLAMGRSAIRLTGQPTFIDKGDNRWAAPAQDSLCWPYGVAAAHGMFAIADSGNNRVLLWDAA